MEDKKVLLSIKDLEVKFRVRGRILTAIRGISLDIYENESIAIVGESGSGKSVFTKTFAGMLDSNGYISNGSIVFHDEELADTKVTLTAVARRKIEEAHKKLDEYAKLEFGAETWKEILKHKAERRQKESLTEEEERTFDAELKELKRSRNQIFNTRQTYDSRREKDKIKTATAELKRLEAQLQQKQKDRQRRMKERKASVSADTAYINEYNKKLEELKFKYNKEIAGVVSEKTSKRNLVLAKEIYLSVGRYGFRQRTKLYNGLLKALREAMRMGVDLDDDRQRSLVFDDVAFRVRYLDETPEYLHGTCILNLANVKFSGDWSQIRGRRIATVFQDPMTSLNPILTIGKQMTSIIIKHQGCSEGEARIRALEMMDKVGIPHPEARFDDYPFQYSGGMRQRIVIAIALSCQPKILICDEPTTALDVTIQAQILQLIKDLQKEFNFTTVFITHDLGVVANIADRVAVLYAGQIVELGTVNEVFYDPRHPYTWALLSSLPQLAQKNTKLYSITGTPPSLYNEITGDAFAPRNPYCMKIDTLLEPPMFPISDTHFAKTWLLEPDAPNVEKPEGIQNIHQKLVDAFNI